MPISRMRTTPYGYYDAPAVHYAPTYYAPAYGYNGYNGYYRSRMRPGPGHQLQPERELRLLRGFGAQGCQLR